MKTHLKLCNRGRHARAGMAAGLLALAASGLPAVAQVETQPDVTREGHIAPRLQNLGNFQRRVTTSNTMAQRFFNQGMVLAYGFNHAEAARSFREAQRLDPQCAMAHWGEALVLGPNINAPMAEEDVPVAYEASRRAMRLRASATPVERALIEALATRYSDDPSADRKALDLAYARAMDRVADEFPQDADVLALAAEAWMDTIPWDYWTRDMRPREATPRILDLIRRSIEINPDHPLAHHLYIHAIESSPDPWLAESSADRLGSLAPAAGHLVHMPSHIYFRIGRYSDAIESNVKAVAADEDYIAQCRAQGLYPAAYYTHNIHFLWIAQIYDLRSSDALYSARRAASKHDNDMAEQLQQLAVCPLHTMVRFGLWEDILSEPAPPENELYTTGIWHFARGMAHAAGNRLGDARQELERVRELSRSPDLPKELIFIYTPSGRLLEIAAAILEGSIAERSGNLRAAVEAYASAARLEETTVYNEPPDWPLPARHWLGAALLADGRAAEAEAVYWADLRQHPENPWGLFGVMKAIEAQGGREDEVESLRSRFQTASARGDFVVSSSRPE